MQISKNLKIGLIVGGVVVAGLLVFGMIKKRKNAPTPVKEQDPVKEDEILEAVVYSKQGTNVRWEPNINSEKQSSVDKAGVALPVLSDIYPPVVDGKYTWVFIQTPDYKHIGWVRSDAVSLTAPKK